MSLDPYVGWGTASVAAAIALVVVVVPGWLLARALGLAQLDRLGLAAPLGVAVLVVAGWLVDAGGFAWTRGSSAVTVTALTALVVVACRIGRAPAAPGEDRMPRTAWVGVAVGMSVAILGTLGKAVAGIRTPGVLSHEPDAQFHLLAITHLLDVGSASPLVSGEVHYYGPSFYPGGFHSVAMTVATWSGAGAAVAAHVVLLLCAAVFWPIGVIALVARTSRSGWVLAAAGPLALTAVFAPIVLLSIGGAWANLMATALLPGALVPAAALVSRRHPPGLRRVVALAVAAVGAGLASVSAQPSAAYAIALLTAAMTGPVVVRWGRAWAAAYCLGVAVVVVAWLVPVNEVLVSIPVAVDPSHRRAVLLLLKNGDVPLWSGAVVAVLTLAGTVIGLRRGGLPAGIALTWLATATLGLALQLGDVAPVQRLTWPWFSAYSRIATMVSLSVVLVGCVAVAALVERGRGRSWRPAGWTGAAAVGVLVAAAVPAVLAGERVLSASYDPDARQVFVTPEETEDLRAIAAELTRTDVVAVDPARGGVFLGLGDPGVVPVGPFYERIPSIELVATTLDHAASDPAVCDAARELGITHALVGGDRSRSYTEIPAYPGIDGVPRGDGFRLVSRSGHFRLYELPRSCVSGTVG